MAVDDHGLEVLKKSGEEITPLDKSDYYIKVAQATTFNTLLALTQSSGFLDGEAYDQIVHLVIGNKAFFDFEINGITQFQVVIEITDQESYRIFKQIPIFNILQENDDLLLQENGDALKTEGIIPV